MQCSIFSSKNREFTYIYLRDGFLFEDLPAALGELLGEVAHVMDLELHPERKLHQEDVALVMANLEEQGFHLQLPPSEDPSGWLELKKRG